MPSSAAARNSLVRLLARAVWGVRAQVLDRPILRSALRAAGRPALWLMHRTAGRAPPQPVARAPGAHRPEPVLKLPLDYLPTPPARRPRIAVLLHAFYVDVAVEMVEALKAIPGPFDLFVSTDEAAKREALIAALSGGPAARVEVRLAPNRGRNFGPQLITFADAYAEHDLVLFLHTKKSTHDDALAGWREFLMESLVGGPAQVRGLIEVFERLPEVGVIAPRTFPLVRPSMRWTDNFPICRELAGRMGFQLYPDCPLDFPAGGMFWARPAALKPILELGLTWDDFHAEAGQRDATLAHALERLVFHACELAGYRWARAGSEADIRPPEMMVRIRQPSELERLVSDCARTVLKPGRDPQPEWAMDLDAPPSAADRKAEIRRLCRDELSAFLARGDRLRLPASAKPEVSILLVLFNQAELTYQCLRSIAEGVSRRVEVIVWDNGSSDETSELLDRVDGARIVRSPENLHYLRAVNAAARQAKGARLLLLNNDARLLDGALDMAAERLEAEPDLGAVAARIELLDGSLQEAGSIIWRDGGCDGYGRGGDPFAGEHQFRRDVDYGSAAFLMLRRGDFERLGGFDEAFAPAYYEETDLCMRLREEGLRIGYEPRAAIRHFEFASSETPSAAIALQAEHRDVFTARHAEVLAREHLPRSAGALRARMRDARPRALILDDRIPYPQLGAGFPRARDLLQAVHDAGFFVTFYPVTYPQADFETAYGALPPDVEIAAERGAAGLVAFLKERRGYYDVAVVSRPHNMQSLKGALAEVGDFIAPGRIIYDAEALFAARDLERKSGPAARAAVRAEAALAKGAAMVLAVNDAETAEFRAAGVPQARVLGHALEPKPTRAGFDVRSGLLFVGALEDDSAPNADSLRFFAAEVMPRLDALIGTGWGLSVAGRTGAASVEALASDRIRLLGRVADLTPLYGRARVFIAPTRFAAGIPMKVHEAAARGLPVVATSLLARQLGWRDGQELLVADDPADFAAACARLHSEPELWTHVRKGALAAVKRDCSPDRFRQTVAEALAAVVGR